MEFDNKLEVPLPPADAWKVLLDIRRIATCIPGAELTEVVDDRTYKGKVGVRLGPVALTLVGQAKFEEIDDANYKARVRTQGSDPKGRGSSDAMINFHLESAGTGTQVLIHTDLKLSGAIAQYGRGAGMIQSFAAQIIDQFGAALKAQLDAAQPVATASSAAAQGASNVEAHAPATAPKPISGFTLIAKVLWDAIRRLFGGPKQS